MPPHTTTERHDATPPEPTGRRIPADLPDGDTQVRRLVTVTGVVQGVGFRPFVHTLATRLGLVGEVANTAAGVVVDIEGPHRAVAEFCDRLRTEPPPLADVSAIHVAEAPAAGAQGFTIRPSQDGQGRTMVPPDAATCDACLAELADPDDRRHRHPFITCTHCGPRFTITAAMPYDRPNTAMAAYPLCEDCAREYADPADRRFHAQPVACWACGPVLRLTSARGEPGATPQGGAALAEARRMIARGAIVAVKGVGGYHLVCAADSPDAVRELRRRKARARKPFAVMAADVATAARLGRVGPAERALLTGPARPIVLLRRHDTGFTAVADVCSGSPDVGVMLPYTPVHRLLFGLPGDPPGPTVLVVTSGNRSGEPLVTDEPDAFDRLAGLADAWLWHDRPITVPCDDSLVRARPDGTTMVLRRSRGYAPARIAVPLDLRPVLAVGGDLKNTLCLAEAGSAWLSAHLGDMGDLAAQRSFERAEAHLRTLTGVTPGVLVTDMHPGYASTRWAARHAAGRPVRQVQHHHAHVAALMAEHGLDGGEPVIGVAFDGTGHGGDGASWGGEVLLADYAGFHRLAHLAYVPQPGGDAAVREPWRMALSHLRAAGLPWAADLPCAATRTDDEPRLLERQLTRAVNCPPTSGIGRLFDAMASLVGICHDIEYEAQAALELEAAAARALDAPGAYAFALRRTPHDGPVVIDPAPVLRGAVDDLRSGAGADVVAVRFHRAVAHAVAAVCRTVRRDAGTGGTVALTGGVFANALLDRWCADALTADGFTVLRHRTVPPGDGGLALGQAVVGGCRN
ncbi:carbamoyltransferase HypF [Yinghuangia sp. ASG 101]|uniref:carbamoyltransferase HypF n=1 Tax=Yinghuangia sp. ASG 101 TaxID=2896848 RepID=UPI001E521077|nr:carbamoyltransferase HypF [Yinghuangia sp. ASG 101]UGQ11500.1 carbamoyltransferase HypF [Yinghuangia sp. ASG 101]